MKKLRKGFTLAEMVMAIMLMSMIAVILGIIFNTMFSSRELIEREASIQSEMRTSMQYVDRTVAKATSVFILDDSKFKGSKEGLTKDWSYIGLSADGKKVLNYVWNKQKQDWDVSELGTKSLYNMKLDLEFKTDGAAYQDNRLINYNLTGQYPDTKAKLEMKTAISALNTKQVFSKVAKDKKGIALAYRNDPIEGQMNVAISFVFDKSGSMAWDLNGNAINQYSRAKSRMSILQDKAKIMMKDLKEIGNVSVNLVSFSRLGSYVQKDFSELDKGTGTIENSIDGLKTGGVTNPGDGLRYGMFSLQNNPAQLKYVVLLTDGIPNAYTVNTNDTSSRNRISQPYYGRSYYNYYTRRYERSIEGYLVTFNNGPFDLTSNFTTDENRAAYDSYSNEALRKKSIEYAGEVSKTFGAGIKRVNVIGFSGKKSEIEYGQDLTDSIGKGGMEAKYVPAADEAALQQTFSDIKKQIQQDLWFVSGP
ncbi:Nitric oxide reductase NorD / putative Von Willebrand factor type A (vWA) domain protein [Streptococcus sp. DD11]|uniref:VWA domain-containing protein n=1 Tax=Streptococcus sp. DD11 TaxID=1777879 RepID=UPI0007976CA6|nr:VWA domain-containing protein [Streptococcus sp. DD11]KXT85006.1 Nitric oxide reductase NorD / putative Von Willebrand factor type A (vWA) domain protein [Streptococcus sp. DD11]